MHGDRQLRLCGDLHPTFVVLYLVQTISVSTNASLNAKSTTRVCGQTQQLVTSGTSLIRCCCCCRRRHDRDARADAGDPAGRGNCRCSLWHARRRLLRGQPASDPVPWRLRHHGKCESSLTRFLSSTFTAFFSASHVNFATLELVLSIWIRSCSVCTHVCLMSAGVSGALCLGAQTTSCRASELRTSF